MSTSWFAGQPQHEDLSSKDIAVRACIRQPMLLLSSCSSSLTRSRSILVLNLSVLCRWIFWKGCKPANCPSPAAQIQSLPCRARWEVTAPILALLTKVDPCLHTLPGNYCWTAACLSCVLSCKQLLTFCFSTQAWQLKTVNPALLLKVCSQITKCFVLHWHTHVCLLQCVCCASCQCGCASV